MHAVQTPINVRFCHVFFTEHGFYSLKTLCSSTRRNPHFYSEECCIHTRLMVWIPPSMPMARLPKSWAFSQACIDSSPDISIMPLERRWWTIYPIPMPLPWVACPEKWFTHHKCMVICPIWWHICYPDVQQTAKLA